MTQAPAPSPHAPPPAAAPVYHFRRPQIGGAVTDLAATVADTLSADVFEHVPLFGSAIKLLKAKDSVSDRLYANKLVSFVQGLEDDPDTLSKLRTKFQDDEEAKRAGKTLLLVIDRLNDFDKPALLGFLCRCFAQEKIDPAALRRLAIAVDVAFADDLDTFLYGQHDRLLRERLLASGLTQISAAAGTSRLDPPVLFILSEMGKTLYLLVNGQPYSA